tara:strand:- start:1909 stop:2115 length:207 start_codon:yes stop_codon:yes gene_type:complete
MVMRTSTEKHTYQRGERTARVFEGYEGYFVELYVKDKLIETRNVFGHSEQYAEDLAENWVDEIIQLNG